MDTTSSAVRVLNAWRAPDAVTTPAPVITHTLGAALIIKAAEACQLPLPSDVLISKVTVEFLLDTVDELQKWSEWLGRDVATEVIQLGPFGSHTHHNIETDLYDIPVKFSTASEIKLPAAVTR